VLNIRLRVRYKMYIKIHESVKGRIVAVCDEDLVGKRFEEGDLVLDLSERFYKGETKKEEEILRILKNEGNINLVGKNSINFAINNQIIEKEHVKYIKKVPYAQVYNLK